MVNVLMTQNFVYNGIVKSTICCERETALFFCGNVQTNAFA